MNVTLRRPRQAVAGTLLAIALGAVLPAQATPTPLEACAIEPLVAGGGNQGILVGSVKAEASSGSLSITYDTQASPGILFAPHAFFPISGEWGITEVHVAVRCSPEDFPVNKQGNPTVGKFDVNKKKLGGVQVYPNSAISVAVPEACPGGPVYVAAHAVVENSLTYQTETAWGSEYAFSDATGAAQWAQFFELDDGATCPNGLTTTAPNTPLPPVTPEVPVNRPPVAYNDAFEYVPALPDAEVPDYNFYFGPNHIVWGFGGPGPLDNDVDPDNIAPANPYDGLTIATVNGKPVAPLVEPNPPYEFTLFKLPSGASLAATATGAFAYNPGSFKGDSDSFTYTVTDGKLTSGEATVTIHLEQPTETKPVAATCYQCDALQCLLGPVAAVCPDITVNGETKVQDVCYTKVVDGAARQITRGCAFSDDQDANTEAKEVGSNSTLPAFFRGKTLAPNVIETPYNADALDCYDVEDKIIGSITCTFISDGVKDPSGVNAPPNLIPTLEALNPPPPPTP